MFFAGSFIHYGGPQLSQILLILALSRRLGLLLALYARLLVVLSLSEFAHDAVSGACSLESLKS